MTDSSTISLDAKSPQGNGGRNAVDSVAAALAFCGSTAISFRSSTERPQAPMGIVRNQAGVRGISNAAHAATASLPRYPCRSAFAPSNASTTIGKHRNWPVSAILAFTTSDEVRIRLSNTYESSRKYIDDAAAEMARITAPTVNHHATFVKGFGILRSRGCRLRRSTAYLSSIPSRHNRRNRQPTVTMNGNRYCTVCSIHARVAVPTLFE